MTDPLIIIQARLGSTRLPKKVLADIGGRAALEHTVRRCQSTGLPVVVATPDREPELGNLILSWENPPDLYEGPEYDVLLRYLLAAKHYKADQVIRVTGDCPFIDPDVILRVADELRKWCDDYISNTVKRTYPRGLDVEGFYTEALETAERDCTDTYDREHVTPGIKRNAIRTYFVEREDGTNLSDLRWVLDTREDLAWFRRVVQDIYADPPHPTTDGILEWLSYHPDECRFEEATT